MENKNLNNYLLQIQEGFLFSDKTISVDLHKFESGEKDKLLIVGFAGSGKSTLGRKLSKKYNCKYYELDDCYWGKGFVKCCYNEIKTSKIRTVVEGVGIIDNYSLDYKNLKNFILKQPIIFLGTSELVSDFRAMARELKTITWCSASYNEERLRKFRKYNPNIDLTKFGSPVKQLKRFRKERISQKNSIIKLFKI